MNKSVCELCRRFGEDTHKRQGIWMCAEHVYLEHSEVIPGFSFPVLSTFHYTTAESPVSEWCERPLEQTILAPDEKVDITPDNPLVYDGNPVAERHKENRMWNYTSDGLSTIHK